MLGNGIAKDRPVARHKVDNSIRESGIAEDFVDEVIGQDGGVAGLPDDAIAHHGGGVSQISSNSCEVER